MIVLVFDAKYLPAIDVFNVYMFFFMVWSFAFPIHITTRVLEKPKIIFYSRVFIFYNVIMDIILVPIMGIMGAVIATGTSIVFVMISQLWLLKKDTILKYPWKNFIGVLINSIPMAIVLFYIEPVIETRLALFLAVFLGIIVYLIAGLINRQFKEDWNILNNASKWNLLKYF